ncbi:MAG: PP2C family protein-serine/threonine phosphatase [Planctomycetota bacterium]|jgi:serine phosphatase RsbU (regulator of sigma subunit)
MAKAVAITDPAATRSPEQTSTEDGKTSASAGDLLKSFTDVLYLTKQDRIPHEIKRLFKQKSLSFEVLPIDKFPKILHRLDLVGTVIIDAADLDVSQQQKLARIIESLEMGNIGTILLNNRVELPVKSFVLAGPQVKSFSLAATMESVSIDELWVRISVNLAYRKKGSEIAVRPVAPPMQTHISHGHNLSDRLQMTGTLVDNLAEQLRMAGLVQRDFLPAQLPNTDQLQWAATYLPAEWVSGDIYDVAHIDDQHIGFYIADAVGRAMPAALLIIFVKQALVMQESAVNHYRTIPPSKVMERLNLQMTAQKLSGYQFATCCYCLLNTKTLELAFSRAGHPYPILIRSNERPRQLEIQGSLLGIFEQSQFPQETIQLQPGDKLLLYSDGAEPFIGGFDDLTGFNFSDEFCQIRDLPAVQMIDEFNKLVNKKKIAPSEVDDITALALEIL